jgi:AraC-like DNA-binding protein
MFADPLSEVLDLVKARCLLSGGLVAGGAWARRLSQTDAITFMAIAEGTCWLIMDELEAPLRLETGDVIMVKAERQVVLTSDPTRDLPQPTVAYDLADGMGRLGSSRELVMLGGIVALDPARQDLLLDVLPPVIHVRGTSNEAAAMQWLIDQLVRERAERPGARSAADHLAQLIFIQALRAYLTTARPAGRGGWLRALADERIAPALRLMHGDPARPWAVGELARAVAMSRTTFALRFKAAAGVAPHAYLFAWRMRLAERELRESDVSVASIAQAFGYSSESAFSNAFKRANGMPPKRYRTRFRTSRQ